MYGNLQDKRTIKIWIKYIQLWWSLSAINKHVYELI